MTAARIRVSMVILDILDVIENSPPDDPPWGLLLCEQTGYGTGTVYPALDKLLAARWIVDQWEEPQPADRPRRRFYRLTEDGRLAYRQALAEREARRAAWMGKGPDCARIALRIAPASGSATTLEIRSGAWPQPE